MLQSVKAVGAFQEKGTPSGLRIAANEENWGPNVQVEEERYWVAEFRTVKLMEMADGRSLAPQPPLMLGRVLIGVERGSRVTVSLGDAVTNVVTVFEKAPGFPRSSIARTRKL